MVRLPHKVTVFGLLILLVILILIACQPADRYEPKQVGLKNSVVFNLSPGFYGDSIQSFLEKRQSPLASCQEMVDEEMLSAAEIIWLASQDMDYSVNPKALLVTLYLENGLTWDGSEGLLPHLQAMAQTLSEGGSEFQQGSRQVILKNGDTISLDARSNDSTFALSRYYADQSSSQEELENYLEDWRSAYYEFFPDEKGVQMPTPMPTVQPFMRLPFDNPPKSFYTINSFFDHQLPRNFNNSIVLRFDGKQYNVSAQTGCWIGVTCYSGHAAIDYGTPMNTPLYAVADGTIIYKNVTNGGIYIDHHNGYISIYWHMERIDVALNQDVIKGQPLGVSGNRGRSTGPHLHFAVRRSSDLVDVDPFGWWSTTTDPWQSLWVWEGDLIADNGEAQSILFYTAYWNYDPVGYGGSSWFTLTVDTAVQSRNWGLWVSYITQPGEYMLYAWWPKRSDTTTDARYQIYHADGMTVVSKSQRDEGDRWVPLGVFNFNQGPAGVILTDLTGDNPRLQRMYFDAIKWEPVNVIQPPTYVYRLPLIYYQWEDVNPPF
jgi:murein DD-endopeptidase MepM/ murein hydrolase activator NlpD